MSNTLTTGYVPHRFQREIHANLKRFSVLVCHRRFGKTVLAINSLIDAAVRTKKERARFAYVAPYLKQARIVAWDYLKHYSRPLNAKINESDLTVEYANGAATTAQGDLGQPAERPPLLGGPGERRLDGLRERADVEAGHGRGSRRIGLSGGRGDADFDGDRYDDSQDVGLGG